MGVGGGDGRKPMEKGPSSCPSTQTHIYPSSTKEAGPTLDRTDIFLQSTSQSPLKVLHRNTAEQWIAPLPLEATLVALMNQKTVDAITTTAEEFIPPKSKPSSKKPGMPWWSPKCDEAVANKTSKEL